VLAVVGVREVRVVPCGCLVSTVFSTPQWVGPVNIGTLLLKRIMRTVFCDAEGVPYTLRRSVEMPM
jgi:hypothetical protein